MTTSIDFQIALSQALRPLELNQFVNIYSRGPFVNVSRVEALDMSGGAYINCYFAECNGEIVADVHNMTTGESWYTTDIQALVDTLNIVAGVRVAVAA